MEVYKEMSISLRYRSIRRYLGSVAVAIMIAAFFLGFAFSTNGTAEQRASFAYNLGLALTIIWAYSSGLAKFLIMIDHKGYKVLNIVSLVLVAFLYILGTQIPPSPTVEVSVLYAVFNVLTSFWLYSWIALDICEIVF